MAATAIAAVIMADAAAMATVEECTRSAAVSMVAAVEVSTVVVVAFTVVVAADTGKLVRLFAPDLCDGPCRVTPGRFAFCAASLCSDCANDGGIRIPHSRVLATGTLIIKVRLIA